MIHELYPGGHNLTKDFLMSLPAGIFLVSNVFTGEQCAFVEKVESPDNRGEQWKRIKRSRASNRKCHVYDDIEEFKKNWQILNVGMKLCFGPDGMSLRIINERGER